MDETRELTLPAVAEPAELVQRAARAADATREIVERTAQRIQGRRYVRVEGWQAIALAHGCCASARDVERTETGFRAIGEIRRLDTGAVVSTAEGFVGDDESTWSKRPEFARRAMAQTRAISRAARSAFAHVVILISSDLCTTPAEEMSTPAQPKLPSGLQEAAELARRLDHYAGRGTARQVFASMFPGRERDSLSPDEQAEFATALKVAVEEHESIVEVEG
jgi:hypothetical protein